MKILHVRSLRTIFLAVCICFFGFMIAYLSGGTAEKRKEEPSVPVVTPSVDLELQEPEDEAEQTKPEDESSEPAEDESEKLPEETTEEKPEDDVASAANYYVRLTRGLSSSEDMLVLTAPSQLKTKLEYRSKEQTAILKDGEKINEILTIIQDAKRLDKDTQIISTSGSHDVSLTLPYKDGFGDIFVFQGYVDGSKKAVTIIQDNVNKLYQAKSDVADKLYDLLKPVETRLDAERINVYAARDYNKGSLKAQVKGNKNYDIVLSVLNSLEKSGSSLALDSPDYVLTLLPNNSVQEKDYFYMWLDEKQVKIAFADDDLTVYKATDVSSREMKKWIKEFKAK